MKMKYKPFQNKGEKVTIPSERSKLSRKYEDKFNTRSFNQGIKL